MHFIIFKVLESDWNPISMMAKNKKKPPYETDFD